ncbi:MAG TPA: hypothetical protein VMI31_11600 [Fimbriimonadaceae bacterium]|nr:hypothetical protein [Fimbriimonadaceae bacterium]
MKPVRILVVALLVLAFTACFASRAKGRPVLSHQVRSLARKLAVAWVREAAPNTLDSLSQRSIALAGMVTGTYVVLDGRRFSVVQALTDGALTILGQHSESEDAGAIRNIVYTLTEIADGRVSRNAK